MHPAFSVIFFTTASGAGYGMLFLFGIGGALGLLTPGRGAAAAIMVVSLALISAGLLSSTAHLGHPERAWRAFSQWRSSWLSREGVFAVLTYGPALVLAWGSVIAGQNDGVWALAGIAAAALAVATVYCTGMIYASLKAIPRWHQPLVTPVYLAMALASGATALLAVLRASGLEDSLLGIVAAVAGAVAWWMKLRYWRQIDGAKPMVSAASAIGVAGTVRPLDPPHTSANYLMTEMGYKIGRKHAARLRKLSLVGGCVAALLCALSVVLPGALATLVVLLATGLIGAAVVIERWLFFAEAQHVVTLYYGEASA